MGVFGKDLNEISNLAKILVFIFKVQDKFRLDLSDEEAVQYLQALIDESVSAVFASVVEQIHKWAQVGEKTNSFIQ